MTHLEALAALSAHPMAWRFRELCLDANPDVEQRDGYRAHVIRLASGEEYPSLARQAGNLAGAVGRVIVAAVTGQAVVVDELEHGRREAICKEPCSLFDAAADRCRKCGCLTIVKPWLATEKCPVGKW